MAALGLGLAPRRQARWPPAKAGPGGTGTEGQVRHGRWRGSARPWRAALPGNARGDGEVRPSRASRRRGASGQAAAPAGGRQRVGRRRRARSGWRAHPGRPTASPPGVRAARSPASPAGNSPWWCRAIAVCSQSGRFHAWVSSSPPQRFMRHAHGSPPAASKKLPARATFGTSGGCAASIAPACRCQRSTPHMKARPRSAGRACRASSWAARRPPPGCAGADARSSRRPHRPAS